MPSGTGAGLEVVLVGVLLDTGEDVGLELAVGVGLDAGLVVAVVDVLAGAVVVEAGALDVAVWFTRRNGSAVASGSSASTTVCGVTVTRTGSGSCARATGVVTNVGEAEVVASMADGMLTAAVAAPLSTVVPTTPNATASEAAGMDIAIHSVMPRVIRRTHPPRNILWEFGQ